MATKEGWTRLSVSRSSIHPVNAIAPTRIAAIAQAAATRREAAGNVFSSSGNELKFPGSGGESDYLNEKHFLSSEQRRTLDS
jgi:hypothetical protein